MESDYLILRRASAFRPSGEWNDDDYDVLCNGVVVGRIMQAAAVPVGSCARTLWTRPKPTTSVTQESASITTLRFVRRLSAGSEKLFMLPPKTSLSLVGASRQKVHGGSLYV